MGFEEFVSEQGQALLRLAYVLTGDAHLAQDLVQTTLADAYQHWRKVKAARQPNAYVRRMLVNVYLSWRRRRSWNEHPSHLIGQTGVASRDPADDVADRDEMRERLGTLAPRARVVLVLRYYADLEDAAIAETMGVSPSAVRATASRALATLRDQGVSDPVEETR